MARNESQGERSSLLLDARPASITLDTTKTAVLVVDMQNDYGATGGLFDRVGIDISSIRNVVAPTATVLASARSIGIPIVYIKAGIRADLSDLGAPGTPQGDRWRAYGVGQRLEAPDGREGRILIRDTWNTDIIPELRPQPGDPIVYKHGYSAFHDTELDQTLQATRDQVPDRDRLHDQCVRRVHDSGRIFETLFVHPVGGLHSRADRTRGERLSRDAGSRDEYRGRKQL